MINTNCSTCCFIDKDKGICSAGQFCIKDNGSLYAPGCCRLQRSHSWSNKHQDKTLAELISIASSEAQLCGTIIIFFDENIHAISQLDKTVKNLNNASYFDHIIIADITKNICRSKILIDYVDSSNLNIKVDYTIDDNRDPTLVIRRIAKQLKSVYFLIMSAGSIILNSKWAMDQLNCHLVSCQSRCAYWYFPKLHGHTILVESNPIDGLYLTKPYSYLINRSQEVFLKQLQNLEQSAGISLSYLFDECVIYNGP